ncbi:cation-transporting P-type ATPase [Marinobacter alexandrii]|uniref:cation-transporting P-type ATPase n=1 Tax=Marinobacter alexandrii TaxID=2570351 RepID=UPI0032670ADA
MCPSGPWHELPQQQALAEFDTSQAGLTAAEADRRLQRYGVNSLPEPHRPGRIARFLRQFNNVLIYVLLGAAVITTTLGHLLDTGVILAVVLANALIGELQEGKAEKAIQAIRSMLALRATVVRDGHRQTIAGDCLVPGDIVLLEAGDKVPADLRLLKAHNLFVQEALLTGESMPVEKQTKPVPAGQALGDRSCMAFSGTAVTAGQASGLVVATGLHTELGRIQGLLADVEQLTTPLVAQMRQFARWLTLFILVMAAALLAYGHWRLAYDFGALLMAVVGLSVAAIPEGLPAVLTITLAVGVQAMASRNAIVRRLPAIETLGAVSVICSDKTGTLTRNEMSVVTVITAERSFTIDGDGYGPDGAVLDGDQVVESGTCEVLTEMAQVAGLCNDAELKREDGRWRVEGDPMEGALLSFSARAGLDTGNLQENWPRTDAIPFDTSYRHMATLHHDHQSRAFIFVKGAPEVVLELCAVQRSEAHNQAPLNQPWWQEQVAAIAASGQRVLAFAARPVAASQVVLERDDLTEGLVFLGLVGLIDPPRSEAIEAVAQCQSAGIRVKMITGDHADTARAIAREVGLENPERVLTGADLDQLTDQQLATAATDTDVFARTSPEHKLRLVIALQAQQQTVAMTGDGVNDAPALKRADIGVAMGLKGSEAAKEASELVLADDNFASIAAAVREGRTIHDNIRKVISWTLPTNAGEASVIIWALLAGLTLPVTPIQILWVNMVTAVTLGVALAFEASEADTMQRPPRERSEPLLTRSLVWHIVLVAVLILLGVFGIFRFAIAQGHSVEIAQTMAMNTLVAMQAFYLLFIRNKDTVTLTWEKLRATRLVWLAIVAVLVGQLGLTYLPLLQRVFSTAPVPGPEMLFSLLICAALFLVIELEKQLRLRLAKGRE